jgi:hypothetical protein
MTFRHSITLYKIGVLLDLALCLSMSVRAQDIVVGNDGPTHYSPLNQTAVEKNLRALYSGNRSILQDSADTHGLNVVSRTPSSTIQAISVPSLPNDLFFKEATPRQLKPLLMVRPPIRRPLPIRPRRDPYQTLVDKLTDPAGIEASGFTAPSDSNQPQDKQMLAQALRKLDQWFPGWTQQEPFASSHFVLEPTFGPDTPDGGAARASMGIDGHGLIEINMASLNNALGIPPLAFMAACTAHETKHIENHWKRASAEMSESQDEALAMKADVQVYQAAGHDSSYSMDGRIAMSETANFRAFIADRLLDGTIPSPANFDAGSGGAATILPIDACQDYLARLLGLTPAGVDYVSSTRSPDGKSYELVFLDDSGHQLKLSVTLQYEGSDPPSGPYLTSGIAIGGGSYTATYQNASKQTITLRIHTEK